MSMAVVGGVMMSMCCSGLGLLMDSSDELQESLQRPWPQAMEGKNSTSGLTNALNAPTRGCQKATKFLEAELKIYCSLAFYLSMKVKCGQESFRMLERHEITSMESTSTHVSTHTFTQSTKI